MSHAKKTVKRHPGSAAKMAGENHLPRERNGRPLFIEGYFSDRVWAGDEPKIAYPRNHVPEAVTIPSMDVKTGYIEALTPRK